MSKKDAKGRMARRRDRFIVGYVGPKNCLFGKNKQLGETGDVSEPMNRTQARKLLMQMPCDDCAIFELVPVELNTGDL